MALDRLFRDANAGRQLDGAAAAAAAATADGASSARGDKSRPQSALKRPGAMGARRVSFSAPADDAPAAASHARFAAGTRVVAFGAETKPGAAMGPADAAGGGGADGAEAVDYDAVTAALSTARLQVR